MTASKQSQDVLITQRLETGAAAAVLWTFDANSYPTCNIRSNLLLSPAVPKYQSKIRHDHFLPNSFEFVFNKPSNHLRQALGETDIQ